MRAPVTDNPGATDSHVKSVTVGTGDNTLANGEPRTGIAGAAGSSQYWTMAVPGRGHEPQVRHQRRHG